MKTINGTIKSTECMFCWNDQTKQVRVVKWPDVDFEMKRLGLTSDVGAKFQEFREMPKQKRQLALLSEALWLIKHRGLPGDKVVDALMQIEECAEIINSDPFS